MKILNYVTLLLSLSIIVPNTFLTEVSAAPLVRLRVVKGPIGTWESSLKGIHVSQAVVTVKNTSAATAEGVTVILKVPGGKEVMMDGPGTLEKYETAEYTMKKKTPSASRGKLWVKFKCKNCRK